MTGERRVAAWAEDHRDDLLAAAMFVVARVLAIGVLGIRMDLRFLTFAPHLPDLDVLADQPLQTLWYLHTQPPLFAGFVALLRGLSPFPDGITFLVAHLAMGLATAIVLQRCFRMMGLHRTMAFVALGLVVTNPALVAIEFVASYDQPTILLLALLIHRTGRYVGDGRTADLAAATGLATAIVLTRTIFHPLWLVLVLAGLVAMRRPDHDRRRLAMLLGAPLVLVGLLIAKNVALYGEPTLTTFQGPSLSKIAGSAVRPAERQALIDDGTVSPLFGRPVFWGYDTYADAMAPCTISRPDVAVLAEPIRPVGGYPNMNYECMLEVYRLQGKDARAYIRTDPVRYAAASAGGTQMFFEPSLPIIFTTNDDELQGPDDLYAHLLFHRVRLAPVTYTEFGELRVLTRGGLDLVPSLVLADVAAIWLGVRELPRLVRRREQTGRSARRTRAGTWAAVGLACGWVTVIGSLLEVNENARYRQLIEPYLIATMVLGAQAAWGWWRARGERSGDPAGGAPLADDQEERTSMSSPMSSTGDELVSDPDDTTSAPVSA